MNKKIHNKSKKKKKEETVGTTNINVGNIEIEKQKI
jgi:hypothetical protein